MPWPTASVGDQTVQVIPVTTSPASPEKPIIVGSLPVQVELGDPPLSRVTVGSDEARATGAAGRTDGEVAPAWADAGPD